MDARVFYLAASVAGFLTELAADPVFLLLLSW